MIKSFEQVFGAPPEVVAEAPGRVNLLGEHTDYNDGFVLPTAIAQRTQVALRRRADGDFALYAGSFDRRLQFSLSGPPPGEGDEHFATYVYGCIAALAAKGVSIPPLDIHVTSTVPMGVGLSSSAALEVATLRALRSLLDLLIDDVRIAQIAQQVEIEYAGVRCGIMDQMASSLADMNHALFLDTRTLERRLIELPLGCSVLVLDSGVSRSLATSGYNERRAECEAAARQLGVPALRDADPAAVEMLPEPLRRRARHVVSENLRVQSALKEALKPVSDAGKFGALMNASHASLRDDFEVSVPALDKLVALLQQHPSVYGARLTGAGFGGACVALCRAQLIAETGEAVLRDYARLGFTGRQLVP